MHKRIPTAISILRLHSDSKDSRIVTRQGIVVNAMLLTFGVLGLMLVLYTTRTIWVTSGLVKGITAATPMMFLVEDL